MFYGTRKDSGGLYGYWMVDLVQVLCINTIDKLEMKYTNLINSKFKSENLNAIWNKLKLHKKSNVNSTLNAYNFENHFNLLMKDEIPLNPDQLKIKTDVHDR